MFGLLVERLMLPPAREGERIVVFFCACEREGHGQKVKQHDA